MRTRVCLNKLVTALSDSCILTEEDDTSHTLAGITSCVHPAVLLQQTGFLFFVIIAFPLISTVTSPKDSFSLRLLV